MLPCGSHAAKILKHFYFNLHIFLEARCCPSIFKLIVKELKMLHCGSHAAKILKHFYFNLHIFLEA